MNETKTPEQILSEIAKIGWMLPGSIRRLERKNKLGETATYFRYYSQGPGNKKTDWKPRTCTTYVLAGDAPAMEELTKAHQDFCNWVSRYADLIFAKTRRERQLPRTPRKPRSKRRDSVPAEQPV